MHSFWVGHAPNTNSHNICKKWTYKAVIGSQESQNNDVHVKVHENDFSMGVSCDGEFTMRANLQLFLCRILRGFSTEK